MTQTIYLDTSVWVSYILGKGEHNYDYAASVMERIDNNTYTAIVTHLVLMEIIGVIRQKIASKEGYTGQLDSTKKAEIKEKMDSIIKVAIEKITDWENEGKVEIRNIDDSVDRLLRNAFGFFKDYFGFIREIQLCSKCQRNLDNKKYDYKALGQYDIQHALLAKALDAKIFIAFDKSFRDLKGVTTFKNITFDAP